MKIVRCLLALSVVCLLCGKSLAADSGTPDSSPPKRAPGAGMGGPLELLRGLNLSTEQKAKFGQIMKEFGPKFKEASEKMSSVYTDEQKAAIKEAVQKARDDGKNFQEIRKVVENAVKLTPEQQTKFDDAKKDIESVQKDLREKMMDILTPEQKEQVEKKLKDRAAEGGKKPADSSK
jgi:Spy/CpxP family protein refolding chaperone